MAINNESDNDLAEAICIGKTTVYGIKKDRHMTRFDIMVEIAKHYDVPIDFFINGEIELKCREWHKVV